MAKKYVDSTALQYTLGQLLIKNDARYSKDGHVHAIGDITALQDALDAKLEAGDVAKLTYSNASMSAVTNVKDALDTLTASVVANKSAIDILNGDANTEGSVDKKIANAIASIDSSALEERVHNNELALETLNGDSSTPGSVDAKINALINGAPGALDTLNELAAALGNDANFATTVTNSIAAKADKDHNHAIANVTGLQDALDAKVAVEAGKSLVADTDIAKIAEIGNKVDKVTGKSLVDDTVIAKFGKLDEIDNKVDKNGTDRLITAEEAAKLADIDTITNADIDTIIAAVFI